MKNNKILWVVLIIILLGILFFGLNSAEQSGGPDQASDELIDGENSTAESAADDNNRVGEETVGDVSLTNSETSASSGINSEATSNGAMVTETDFASADADGGVAVLTQNVWQWQESRNNNGSRTVPTSSDKFILTFRSDGTFSSSTDCNQVGGQYVADGNQLRFDNMFSTKIACAPETLESTYLKSISNVTNWGTNIYGQLVLFMSNGETMVFNQV
jgi:heat shock protein HslJ